MADTTSPDGLELSGKQPKGQQKNRPRSNRILVIVVTSVAAVFLLILLNIDTRGPSQAKKEIKASQIVAAGTEGLTLERPDDRPFVLTPTTETVSAEPMEKEEAILLPDGTIGTRKKQVESRTNIKIIRKEPSENYRKSRELLLAALHAKPDVDIRNDDLQREFDDDGALRDKNGQAVQELTSPGGPVLGQSSAGPSTSGFSNPNTSGGDSNASAMAHQDRNVSYAQSHQGDGNASSITGEYNPNTRRPGISKYELKAGTVIQGVLTGGINSDLPGTVIGQVTTHVWDTATGAYKLIPQGARLVGEYDSHVVYGQNRVLVVWKRIIYPDGTSLNLEGLLGADRSGYSGFKQKIDNHYSRMVGAALLASVFVAAGKIATDDDKDKDGNESKSAEAVMEQMTSLGARLVERNMNVAPTLRILPGYQFSIITTKDIAFAEPYYD